jgi:hypothetical protein
VIGRNFKSRACPPLKRSSGSTESMTAARVLSREAVIIPPGFGQAAPTGTQGRSRSEPPRDGSEGRSLDNAGIKGYRSLAVASGNARAPNPAHYRARSMCRTRALGGPGAGKLARRSVRALSGWEARRGPSSRGRSPAPRSASTYRSLRRRHPPRP